MVTARQGAEIPLATKLGWFRAIGLAAFLALSRLAAYGMVRVGAGWTHDKRNVCTSRRVNRQQFPKLFSLFPSD